MAIPIVPKRSPQLPVRKVIPRTWKLTFRHQRTFWRFLLPPVVVITVVSYAAFYYVMFVLGLEASHTPILVAGLLAGIPMAMVTFRMATMWHRWVLLEALPEGIADSFKFGKQEILFLLVFVIFGLLVVGLSDLFATHIAPLLAGSFPESTLDSAPIDRQSNLPGMATTLVKGVLFFTFSRFLILLPAIAIDKAMSVKDAWRTTQGNAIGMGLVLIFTSYLFDFISDLAGAIVFILTQGVTWKFPFYGYFRADLFAPQLVKWIGAPISILLGATALSLCYRHLTGTENPIEKRDETGIPATTDP